MAIRTFGGDLGILGLANLLQMVSMSQSRGILSLTHGTQKALIQFCTEGIRLVSGAGRAMPLGRILVRSGKITTEQLDEVLADQRRSGQRLGDLILEEGLVTKADMDSALRELQGAYGLDRNANRLTRFYKRQPLLIGRTFGHNQWSRPNGSKAIRCSGPQRAPDALGRLPAFR